MKQRRFKPDANVSRRKRRAAASLIERRPCADPERRARLEADPAEWLRFYLPAAFPLPFGDVHLRMIGAAVRAIRTGAGMAVAAPRGTGKSTVLWAIALWALLSGACRFPVVSGWSHGAARRMLKKWIGVLADNKLIQSDYPDATLPFEESTHANRLRHIVWQETGEVCGADVQQLSGTVVLPDGLGALGAVSIQGSVRGLSVGLPDGTTARPDVLLLDDPQDKSTAESPKQVRQVVERIEADLFNVSGPDVRLAVMAAVTVIADGDVAVHFLEHPDFEGIRVPQITQWPDGWEDKNSAVRAQWNKWNEIRVAGIAGHDNGEGARGFYEAHKAELTAGMTVSWPDRYDRKRNDPDALYAAMLDFYRLGERSFMAERQNAPMATGEAALYDLPHATVASKVTGLDRRQAPDGTVALCGMVDVNADGLRWALAAVSNTAAISVVDYGVFPGGGRMLIDGKESEPVALSRGLSGLDQLLRGIAVKCGDEQLKLDLMLVDCGWLMEHVFTWLASAARVSPVPWFASRGWAARSYRPANRTTIGRPGDNWHVADWHRKGRVLVHNSDVWRHRQQRGWLLPTGAPDSIALFGTPGTRHDHFADGVVAERLVTCVQTDQGPLYRWNPVPGLRNDWGDVATGLCVAASRLGLTSTGAPAKRKSAVAVIINGRRVTSKAAKDSAGGSTDIHAPKHRAVIGRPSGQRTGWGRSWSKW